MTSVRRHQPACDVTRSDPESGAAIPHRSLGRLATSGTCGSATALVWESGGDGMSAQNELLTVTRGPDRVSKASCPTRTSVIGVWASKSLETGTSTSLEVSFDLRAESYSRIQRLMSGAAAPLMPTRTAVRPLTLQRPATRTGRPPRAAEKNFNGTNLGAFRSFFSTARFGLQALQKLIFQNVIDNLLALQKTDRKNGGVKDLCSQ